MLLQVSDRSFAMAGAIVVCLFWASWALHRSLGTSYGRLLAEHPRPYLLNGMLFTGDRFFKPRFHWRFHSGRSLILVCSDECPYSAGEVQNWVHLLRTTRFRSSDHVLVVSLDGSDTYGRLKMALRPVKHGFVRVERAGAFVTETGIGWTPHTLVLDERRRIRISSETATREVREMISGFFDQ